MSFNPDEEKPTRPVTPESVRNKVDLAMKPFGQLEIEGKDALAEFQEKNPDARFIMAGSHFGMDVHAALSALGDRFDIQVTGESLVHDEALMEFFIKTIGEDRFSDLQYKKTSEGKTGVFNPDNFVELEEKMEQGRTPWMAINAFATDEKMSRAKIGSAYLAQKTGSFVVPTAFYVENGPSNVATGGDIWRLLKGKVKGELQAHYKVGEPMKLEPIDNVQVIEEVYRKRRAKEKVTPEERAEFSRVNQELKTQAESIAKAVAELLPEEHRGFYQDEE